METPTIPCECCKSPSIASTEVVVDGQAIPVQVCWKHRDMAKLYPKRFITLWIANMASL